MNAKPLTLAMLLMGFAVYTAFALLVLPVEGQAGEQSLYFPTTATLQLQCPSHAYVTLEVTSGTLNGTNCQLWWYKTGGMFRFTALDDAAVTVIDISNRTRFFANNEQTSIFNVVDGGTYNLYWTVAGPSLVDDYFLVGIGLFGLGLCVVCPVVAIRMIKAGDIERVEYVALCFVLVLIGAGLVMAWLW